MRGRNPNEYVPGDFTAGSSRALGAYAKENKSKLATAGGAGAASMVGLAIGGPIGFVAGSYLGAKVTKSVVGEDAPKCKIFYIKVIEHLNMIQIIYLLIQLSIVNV